MSSSDDHRHTHDGPTVNESPFPVSSDDPTATKTLRNRYSAEMYRRFRALKSAIVTGVVERDALGIADLSPAERAGPRNPATFSRRDALDYAANPLGPPGDPERFEDYDECVDELSSSEGTTEADARQICGAWEQRVTGNALEAAQDRVGGAGAGINIEPPRAGEFAFPSDERKVAEFLSWLATQTDRGILEADPTSTGRTVGAHEGWQNTYLRQAYSKGVTHADAYLVDQGVIPPTQTLDDVFRAVKHADAAGLIFVRSYNELDGVTDVMAQRMGRVLADGLTRGLNPREIARELNAVVDDVGIHRGRLIARTETIRAHNEAALNRYEDMGNRLDGVTTLAEHITAGDNRVCPECEALEGTIYTIPEARGRIPVHPNCRCTWVPVDSRDVPPGQGGTATAAERVEEFFEATADLEPEEQVARASEWLSNETRLGHETGRQAIRLDGLEPDRAEAISRAILKLEHADLLGPVGEGNVSVATADEVRNSPGLANALAWAKRQRVTFNSDLYTLDRLARLRDEGWLTGRFFRGEADPLEAGVIHEFGHVFHYLKIVDAAERRRQAILTGRFGPEMRDKIGARVSRYASTNAMEFVAEMFVRIAYDMPVSDDLLLLYERFDGPDPDRFRGFMLSENPVNDLGPALNMSEDTDADDVRANVEETEVGDFPEDIPPELRAEAENTYYETFADLVGDLDGEE